MELDTTTTKKAATETCYIINTIVLVFCLRRKQYNEDKQHKWMAVYPYLTINLLYTKK